MMIRFLPALVELVLVVYCVIDIIQSPEHQVRNLPKWGWLVLVLVVPLIGAVAWLVAGRPQRESRGSTWGQGAGFPEYQRPAVDTSDIDRRVREELDRVDREFEEALRIQQERLRAKEAELSAREEALDRRDREEGSSDGSSS